MKPEIWGKHFWFVLHTIAYTYPEKPSYVDKKNAIDFFTALGGVLPCEKCQVHYYENLKHMPVTVAVDSRADLMDWVFRLHNRVNLSTGKPELTKEQAHEQYLQFILKSKAMDKPDYKLHVFYGTIIVGLSIALFYKYSYKV